MVDIHTSYLICGVQRSGSFLLCEALKNTGLAGVPEEYFLGPESYIANWENGEWARQNGAATRQDFLRLVLEKGSTPNGVCGAKLMWNCFAEVMRKLGEMHEYQGLPETARFGAVFPNLHYIWIVRRNRLRQAVSWARAAQTRIYAWNGGEPPAPGKEPHFDFTFIDNLHRLVREGEAGWQAYFQACGATPFKVVYEELVENYEGTALAILDFLGCPIQRN